MAVPARLSIVTLGVADVDRSVAFYAALGWERRSSSIPGVIAWFSLDRTYLGLFPRDELAADAGLDAPGPPPRFRGATLAINVATEPEVQAAIDAAVAGGGTQLKPATRAEWGGLSGYFADPDGHAWEVAWNPSFPIDDEGRITIP